MASGVRLHHPTLRGCTYTVVHFGRPYVAPVTCGVCSQIHLHKTYHLGLNKVGDVTVSETIYERLKEADLSPMVVLGEDKDPEPIRLDMSAGPAKTLVVSREKENV